MVISTFVVLTIFVISTSAEDPPAEAPASGGGGGSADAGNKIVLDGPTTPSPEEVALDTSIKELITSQCKIAFGNCFLHKLKVKPYYTEEKRIKLCQKEVKGFSPCHSMTEEQFNEAKTEAEERKKRAEEEEEERLRLIEEEKAKREEKKKEMEEAKAAKEKPPEAESSPPPAEEE